MSESMGPRELCRIAVDLMDASATLVAREGPHNNPQTRDEAADYIMDRMRPVLTDADDTRELLVLMVTTAGILRRRPGVSKWTLERMLLNTYETGRTL